MKTAPQPSYRLNADGTFTIAQYNQARPFASFFPGLAGLTGTPLWCFYVNRGQCVASFGRQDKDHAILEFFPADQAWSLTPIQGLRTFIKAREGKKAVFHEPFRLPGPQDKGTVQTLTIGPGTIWLEETAGRLPLRVRTRVTTLPGQPFPALVRELSLLNTSRRMLELELLDGLPRIVPDGMHTYLLKHMSRTSEAWMTVENLDAGLPFYKFKYQMLDRPELLENPGGHFFLHEPCGGAPSLEPVRIADPASVFGEGNEITLPHAFLAGTPFSPPAHPLNQNRFPCALALYRLRLAPGAEQTFQCAFGWAPSLGELNRRVRPELTPGLFDRAARGNDALLTDLCAPIATRTGLPAFDAYCRQSFLDNVLRGGSPVRIGPARFYAYSRKHGDLERDYNNFLLLPEYFSCGNGNYRDVNQNRRNDVRFFPFAGEDNVQTFLDLIQLDGYNPLSVEGSRFHLSAETLKACRRELETRFHPPQDLLDGLNTAPFTPGAWVRQAEERFGVPPARGVPMLETVLAFSGKTEQASHGEGFWTDHWTYNTDLIEAYLQMFPEKLRWLLLEKADFTFFDSDHRLVPRAQRYVLANGQPRQLNAVTPDAEKAALIASRTQLPRCARTQGGHGAVLRTTLAVKLLSLAANKLAALDPHGIGVEMEAGKPDWYDALNGLPALCGSSTNETFELKRLIRLLGGFFRALRLPGDFRIPMPVELCDFIFTLDRLMEPADADRFRFWDESHSAAETYRDRVFRGVDGAQAAPELHALERFLARALARVEDGLARAFDKGLYHTYYINRIRDYEPRLSAQGQPLTTDRGHACIRPRAFDSIPLPLFLEGQVHALRVETDRARAAALHRRVKASALYDRALGLYKVNAPLGKASPEIGRTQIFTPGWLENESVWLHMQYKYLLELLRAGLHETFFEEFRRVLIPFQPPRRYGRSILENSSFLVSSAFPDRRLHGAGFVSRLSGATAEMLHLWQWMFWGRSPLGLNEDASLRLSLRPALPGWIFTKKPSAFRLPDGSPVRLPAGTAAALFAGGTLTVYHNPRFRTLAETPPSRIECRNPAGPDGKPAVFHAPDLPAPFPEEIRGGKSLRLDVFWD